MNADIATPEGRAGSRFHQHALLLVGHGSVRHPEAAQPVLALAKAVRARGIFAEVTAVFMKQAPVLAEADRLVAASTVHVVPVFAGQGYYTDVLIPREMRLEGPITCRDGRTFHYGAPAGTHPRVPGLMAGRAEAAARAAGMDPTDTALLLVAHGSSRPGPAGGTARTIAAAIAASEVFGEVALSFLEQDPIAADWRRLTTKRHLVVLPLLVAQGMHASRDIPPLFDLEFGQTGPVELDGRRIVLTTGLGAEPELVDVVLDLAGVR